MVSPVRRLACLAVLGVLVAVAGLLGTGVAAPAQAQDTNWTLAPADEAEFIDHINAARAAEGLGPLTLDPSMRTAARSWTYWMAENLTLAHADDIVTGAPTDWQKVGENVGRGGSLIAVWEAFMASPSHAANVLDPSYDLVGIGVVWTDDGRLYTTHRFAATPGGGDPAPEAPAPAPPAPASEPEPASEPAPTPPAVEPPATLPFEDEDRAAAPAVPSTPVAEPARLAATMRVLLAAGT